MLPTCFDKKKIVLPAHMRPIKINHVLAMKRAIYIIKHADQKMDYSGPRSSFFADIVRFFFFSSYEALSSSVPTRTWKRRLDPCTSPWLRGEIRTQVLAALVRRSGYGHWLSRRAGRETEIGMASFGEVAPAWCGARQTDSGDLWLTHRRRRRSASQGSGGAPVSSVERQHQRSVVDGFRVSFVDICSYLFYNDKHDT
jgi:hypothetical protein